MERTSPKWRLNALFLLIGLVLVILIARLALMMEKPHLVGVKTREEARAMIEQQQRRYIPVPARPGSIYAYTRARPVLLAGSRQVPSVYADPSFIPDNKLAQVSIDVGRILDMDPLAVQNAIVDRRDKGFAWIKRRVTTEQADALRKARIKGFGVQYEKIRHYPAGDLAAAVLGFCQGSGEAGGGLELVAAKHLAAKDGLMVMISDAARRPIWPLPEECRDPVDGGHVILTIDASVQKFLQDAISESLAKYGQTGRTWGAGIVIDPQTGRILAMASLPTFDPNVFTEGGADAATLREALLNATNRCVTVPYEPGSVFKPIVAAAAVQRRKVTWQDRIDCGPGTWTAPKGGTISDHGHAYGVQSVEDVIANSSNIGMGHIGLLLGNEELYNIVHDDFGFGRPTSFTLPGESSGIVRPKKLWDTYSTPRVPFGQEISATTLQLTMAFSALCNGGWMLQPQIVDHITDASGNVEWQCQTVQLRRVLDEKVSRGATAAMQAVVERGTGKAVQMKKWSSFGKTGTAQIAAGGRYVERAFTASFIGGAPVDNPKVLVAISIYWPKYEGHFGSVGAAPFVKQVLEKTLEYLEVPPDRTEADDIRRKEEAQHKRGD